MMTFQEAILQLESYTNRGFDKVENLRKELNGVARNLALSICKFRNKETVELLKERLQEELQKTSDVEKDRNIFLDEGRVHLNRLNDLAKTVPSVDASTLGSHASEYERLRLEYDQSLSRLRELHTRLFALGGYIDGLLDFLTVWTIEERDLHDLRKLAAEVQQREEKAQKELERQSRGRTDMEIA